MKNFLFLFIATAVLVACSPKVTETETADAMSAEAATGKSVFSQKCKKCHDLPVVDSYSKEKWDKILPVMSEKAKLIESERGQVEVYINWELEH